MRSLVDEYTDVVSELISTRAPADHWPDVRMPAPTDPRIQLTQEN